VEKYLFRWEGIEEKKVQNLGIEEKKNKKKKKKMKI